MLSRALESTAYAALLAASLGCAAAQTYPPPPVTQQAPTARPDNELPPAPQDEAAPGGSAGPSQFTPMPSYMTPVPPPSEPLMQNVGVPVPDGPTVASLPDASSRITGVTVQSADGATIGRVAGVVTDQSGEAQKVTVAVTGAALPARAIGIAAIDLHYQPDKNIVVAQLTEREMRAIAAARTPGDVPP